MVKISSDELNNFYIPIPPLEIQRNLVCEIKEELNKQDELTKKIEEGRIKITQIIEDCIKAEMQSKN